VSGQNQLNSSALKNKKLFPLFFIPFLVLFISLPYSNSYAQWSIGGAFEIQDEDPTNGFSLRIEREMLKILPAVDIRLRLIGSRLGEDVDINVSGIRLTQNITLWEGGLTGIAGFSTGVLRLYSGFGGGFARIESEAEDVEFSDVPVGEVIDEVSESSFYWNIIAGFEFTPIPLITPFFEYRFINVTDDDGFGFDNINRLALGVSVGF